MNGRRWSFGSALGLILSVSALAAVLSSPARSFTPAPVAQDLMDPERMGDAMAALRRLAVIQDTTRVQPMNPAAWALRPLTQAEAADSLLFMSAGRLADTEGGRVRARWGELDSLQLLYARMVRRVYGPTMLGLLSLYLTGSGTIQAPQVIQVPVPAGTTVVRIPFPLDSITHLVDSAFIANNVIRDMQNGGRGFIWETIVGVPPCSRACKPSNLGELRRADSLFQAGDVPAAVALLQGAISQ